MGLFILKIGDGFSSSKGNSNQSVQTDEYNAKYLPIHNIFPFFSIKTFFAPNGSENEFRKGTKMPKIDIGVSKG
jgi:hypothetical protein